MRYSFINRWLFPTDHKRIGTLYLVFAFVVQVISLLFLVYGSFKLSDMRASMLYYSASDIFNSYYITILFFVPLWSLMGGFGNWLVPLMIGAKNVAFPHTNCLIFWLNVCALISLLIATVLVMNNVGLSQNTVHDAGILARGMIAIIAISPIILMLLGVLLGIGFIVTILTMRTVKVTVDKSVFVWSVFVTGVLLFFSFIGVILAGKFLSDCGYYPTISEITVGCHPFYIFEHYHPYVICFLGFGMFSCVLLNFSHKSVASYFSTPNLFVFGFVFLLMLATIEHVVISNGILAGIFDVVIHLKETLYTLIFFAFYAGFYHFFGKISGRQYPQWMGRLDFLVLFIGVNLYLFPHYFSWIFGMEDHLLTMFFIGRVMMGYITVLIFMMIIIYTLLKGKKIENNFWNNPKLS